MTPIAGGLVPRERVRVSSGSRPHSNRGRPGLSTAMALSLGGRPSLPMAAAVFGNPAMVAKSGGNKRRQMAQRRAAKRKIKSKSGENDSKLNRNQQSNESSGALGCAGAGLTSGQWYDDQFANNLDDNLDNNIHHHHCWPKQN